MLIRSGISEECGGWARAFQPCGSSPSKPNLADGVDSVGGNLDHILELFDDYEGHVGVIEDKIRRYAPPPFMAAIKWARDRVAVDHNVKATEA